MNIKKILYFLGWILLVEAFALLPPALIASIRNEGTDRALLFAFFLAMAVGIVFSRKSHFQGSFFAKEGYIATALGWVVLSLIGALPFFLSGKIPNYEDALFEIVSGFTTTGSSILNDVESLGKGLLFWRSFSHWIGGMGVLVFVLAFLPSRVGSNMQLMKAESPGPEVSKLVPRVRDSAKALYAIYFIMTVAMIVTYMISGMGAFDAFCIGFGTAGTGGFAIRNSGMADYSMVSQTLITLWMLLFGINFNVYYLFARRKFKDALKSEEVRIYLGIVLIATLTIALTIFLKRYQDEGFYYSLHHSAFTVGSLITTTGFSTLDFSTWPQFVQVVLLTLMFIGACAGSTGGGIKVARVTMLFKEIQLELHLLVHPSSVRTVRFEGKTVDRNVLRSVNSYLAIYIFIFLISLVAISLDGFDFTTNFSAVAATMNNIGPGFGLIGPCSNFANYSALSKLVLSLDMLAGRLELLPMLMLFNPRIWKKHY